MRMKWDGKETVSRGGVGVNWFSILAEDTGRETLFAYLLRNQFYLRIMKMGFYFYFCCFYYFESWKENISRVFSSKFEYVENFMILSWNRFVQIILWNFSKKSVKFDRKFIIEGNNNNLIEFHVMRVDAYTGVFLPENTWVSFYYSSCDSMRAPRGISPRFKYLPARSFGIPVHTGNNKLEYQPFRPFLPTLFSFFLSFFRTPIIVRNRWYVNYANCTRNACSSANSGSIKCNWGERASNWVQGNNKFEEPNLTG